jgi:hypothetical protein
MLVGGRRLNVVGESHYQAALERIVGGRTEDGWNEGVVAHLVREPTNRYDANAIKVMVGEGLVAYFARADALAYQAPLRTLESQGLVPTCRAQIVGGWRRNTGCDEEDEGFFGIWLDLATPGRCLP